MSRFGFKILAAISMFIDHSTFMLYMHGYIASDIYILLRGIGRLAFPIYCYLIVVGFSHSSDRRKYALRLMSFALISQLPFTLVFCVDNYRGAVWGSAELLLPSLGLVILCLFWLGLLLWKKRPVSEIIITALFILLPGMRLRFGSLTLLDGHMSVLYTLALGLMLIAIIDGEKKKSLSTIEYIFSFLALAGAVILIETDADYGLSGLMLILLLYIFRRKKPLQLIWLILWSAMQYGFEGANLTFTLFAALSALPISLFNGRRGPALRYFFYCFYPIHLLLLGLISFCI